MTSHSGDVTEDQQLVRIAQRELPYVAHAYTTLMRRYEAPLLRYCTRFLGNRAEAEDALQEVMLRVFRGLPDFLGDSSFKTWIFRIARNLCATRYRRLQRELEVLRAYGEVLPQSTEDGTDIEHDLYTLLGQVSDADREILLLRFESGLAIQEIAEVMGVSLSAAKMRLYRAAERITSLADG